MTSYALEKIVKKQNTTIFVDEVQKKLLKESIRTEHEIIVVKNDTITKQRYIIAFDRLTEALFKKQIEILKNKTQGFSEDKSEIEWLKLQMSKFIGKNIATKKIYSSIKGNMMPKNIKSSLFIIKDNDKPKFGGFYVKDMSISLIYSLENYYKINIKLPKQFESINYFKAYSKQILEGNYEGYKRPILEVYAVDIIDQ